LGFGAAGASSSEKDSQTGSSLVTVFRLAMYSQWTESKEMG
jgi:hypothetical protein